MGDSKTGESFRDLVLSLIKSRGVPELLASRPAFVLERVARGGGRAEWYYCIDSNSLAALVERVSPGSAVSFYFDNRMQMALSTAEVVEHVLGMGHEPIDAVVGVLAEDGVSTHAEVIVGRHDLLEWAALAGSGSPFFYGCWPARDDDGINAVTLVLPDRDGVLRSHPH